MVVYPLGYRYNPGRIRVTKFRQNSFRSLEKSRIVRFLQGCQIKILEIGIFLPKIGKYRKMHLAKSEKKSESDFQAFQSLS